MVRRFITSDQNLGFSCDLSKILEPESCPAFLLDVNPTVWVDFPVSTVEELDDLAAAKRQKPPGSLM